MAETFEQLQSRAAQAAVHLSDVRSNGDLSVAARAQRITAAGSELRRATEADLNALDTAVADLKKTLGRLALPPRPAGDVAAQEARLSNLRQDASMVLDRTAAHDLPRGVAELVAGWVESPDSLAVWFLASSDWLSLYLRSRDASDAVPLVESAIGAALRPAMAEDTARARTILAMLSGRDGLAQAVVRMRFCLDETLRDLGVAA